MSGRVYMSCSMGREYWDTVVHGWKYIILAGIHRSDGIWLQLDQVARACDMTPIAIVRTAQPGRVIRGEYLTQNRYAIPSPDSLYIHESVILRIYSRNAGSVSVVRFAAWILSEMEMATRLVKRGMVICFVGWLPNSCSGCRSMTV